jgi:hypothetical protein
MGNAHSNGPDENEFRGRRRKDNVSPIEIRMYYLCYVYRR